MYINPTFFALKRVGGAFGKSVIWLDNSTFAVLAYSASGAPWASSQLFVFDVSSQWPIFSFPNNQQPIGDFSVQSPTFLQFSTSGLGDLAILLNSGELLPLPSTPPGIRTTCVIDSTTLPAPFRTCTFTGCPSGTYKQSPSIGPCYVCPPGTKNPKTSNVTDIECEPCSSDAYCPLAAVDDVLSDPYTLQITQALSYPESPDSTIFDDILIQNIFSLQISPRRCLLISPLFWTLLTVGLAGLILVIASVLQLFPGSLRHYFLLKRIFRQTDLIGEGELWIGGLFSFSIVVLVSFAYAFSSNYVSLYPIELSGDAQLACDTTMRNAKFSTGVLLLSVPITEEEAPIFDLLDAQSFTLSVDFLNTLPACINVMVVQTSGLNEIPLERYTCTNTTSAIATVSLQLPIQQLTITINISNSNSIGALRVCLMGPGFVQEGVYTLQSLKFCEFFGTQNQTLSYTPEIEVSLTKVINKTQPLVSGGQTQYSGLFIPTIVAKGLSDQARYDRLGDYLRYLSMWSLITIDISETQFYLKNTQEPIARQAEVIFHTLLFTIVALELYGLVFLLFKLGVAPLFRLVVGRCSKNNRVGIITDDDESSEPKKNLTLTEPRPQTSEQTSVRCMPGQTLKSVW
jgi:hypothetical protein